LTGLSLSGDTAAIIAAILGAVVAVTFEFGHKFSNECSKYDEPEKSDELAKILSELRFTLTVEALEDLRTFISGIEGTIPELESSPKIIRTLMLSTEYGADLKRLIEVMEKSVERGKKVKDLWHGCQSKLGRLARLTYAAAFVLSVGFLVDFVEYVGIPELDQENLLLPWVSIGVAAVILIGLASNARTEANLNLAGYRKYKEEFFFGDLE